MQVEKTAELSGHANPIFALAFSQKPGIIFTAGNDKGVVEWNTKTNAFIKVMFPVVTSVYALHCPAGFPLLFAGLRNGDVLVFDFLKQQLLPTLKHHLKPIFDIQSVSHKKELLVASEDGSVSIWNLEDLSLVHTIPVAADTVRCISVSAENKQVAFGCRDNTVRIYDLEDYTPIRTLTGHTLPVFSVAYAPLGNYLVSGSRDAQLKIWDCKTFELIQNVPAHLFAVNSIAFHPTEPYFATASMDKSIKIWGSDDFKLYKIISREKGFATHRLSINKIAWSADGNKLVSVGDDKLVMVWEFGF
ncbi:WD40 repeat domain-containing protein [uncultured Mucilaginibacter sp.]|uniref:WD40 repeat domain-containing protein n=1 Tax=uncultured Mucilaginibacter sp. TaxID=797541 RepID=UPI002638F779|nr:WD40 repeat domain-containing protein [uncultured Mucilaginibacter sp.]